MNFFFNHTRAFFFIGIFCFAFLLSITAHAITPQPEPQTIRLGIVLPSMRESRWQQDLESFQNIAEGYGMYLRLRIAGNDQEKQNIQIKELVTLGIDTLIVVPDDVTKIAPAIDYAKEHNVYVIAYDRLPQNCDVDVHVTFDNTDVGKFMGKFLAAQAPTGNYILLTGPASDSASPSLLNGALTFLQPLIDAKQITVITQQPIKAWHPRVAKNIVEEAIKKETPVAILAPNDDTAGGAIEALTEAGLAGSVYITGQDATTAAIKRIEAGTQSMTVHKNTNLLVRKAMDIVLDARNNTLPSPSSIVNNGYKDVPTYYVPIELITKDNLQWFLRSTEFVPIK